MMETAITINGILGVFAIIVALVGGAGAIKKIIAAINAEHDSRQKYDRYEEQINELNTKIETAHTNANDRLIELSTNTEAKLQEIKAEQCMLTYCMMAVLDGLQQLNCNGKVTKASTTLDKYLNKQAHGVD